MMNVAVEATNKNIKKILQRWLWLIGIGSICSLLLPSDKRSSLLLYIAYQTLIRSSNGATPFSMIYGMEAVLPIKVEIPSLWLLMETKLEEAERVMSIGKSSYDNPLAGWLVSRKNLNFEN